MMSGFRAVLLAAASGTVLLAATGACAQPVAQPETLADALTLAYQTNPTLQSQRAQLRALDETYVQARVGYRPQVSGSLEADYAKSTSTDNLASEPVSATLSISQPIYTGGFTSASVRAAEGDIRSGREQLRQTEAGVMQSVIQAYVDVLRDQQALTIQVDNVNVLKHQLAETKAKFEVGQITRTDVAQGEARLAGARAGLAAARAQLGVSRANYTAVVGQSPGDLAPEPELPGVPATVDQAFDTAERNNPGILAADYAEQAAAARVAAAKAADRPSVSLRATYGYDGFLKNQPPLFETTGAWQRGVTASAVVTQPLFTGGMNASHIRQAVETDNTKRIGVEGARRQAVQAVSQAWNQLLAARASVTADSEQVRADKIAYEGAGQEHDVGLRTTLDVLNAEQELHNAELALVDARHDQYVATANVLNAMGLLEARNLTPTTPAYDPVRSFNKVRHSGAVPWEGVVAGVDGAGAPTIKKRPPVTDVARPAQPSESGAEVVE
jgi:outer membrane protein